MESARVCVWRLGSDIFSVDGPPHNAQFGCQGVSWCVQSDSVKKG